jgi:hypothetical protein
MQFNERSQSSYQRNKRKEKKRGAREPNHLSSGSEVDLKSRVDTSGLLAGAGGLGSAATRASGTGNSLVLAG